MGQTQKMGSAHNGAIDLLKFIFAIVIALYHTGCFYCTETQGLFLCGYIGVEFFFIVSGYLLALKAANCKGDRWETETCQMIRGKILHIFPYVFLAILASLVVYSIGQVERGMIGCNLALSFADMLGLQMCGFPGYWGTGVAWYLSALFFVSMLIYPILLKKRTLFTKWIAPLTVLFIYGYMHMKSGSLNNPGDWWGSVYKGLLRGYADISVGCIAYEISLYLNQSEVFESKSQKLWLFFAEISGFVLTFVYAFKHGQADFYDFIIAPFLMLSVAVCFSEHGVLQRVFSSSFFSLLGTFSMSIYLNHYYVSVNMTRLFPDLERTQLLVVFLGIVFSLAILNCVLGKLLSKVIRSIQSVCTICMVMTIIGFILI
ncbi:MAG: acyltransferase family protein [Wujia sp.]